MHETLKNNAKNIINRGYMPTSNKNLLTFTVIGVVVFAFGQTIHALGYAQAQADCKHQNKLIGANIHNELSSHMATPPASF